MVFCYVSAFLTRQEEAGEAAEEGQFAAADPIRNDEPSPTVNVDWASQPEAHWVSGSNNAARELK